MASNASIVGKWTNPGPSTKFTEWGLFELEEALYLSADPGHGTFSIPAQYEDRTPPTRPSRLLYEDREMSQRLARGAH